MIKAIDLRKGKTIMFKGDLSIVHEVRHVVKGKGQSYMSAKIKNYKTGTITDVRYNVDERIEVPFVESKNYEYLYQDGDQYIVMDSENYEQMSVSAELVGDAVKFLKPNEKVSIAMHEGHVVSFELPFVVDLEVTETPPVVKGSTATNQLKEAILETGAKIRVPPFIDSGTSIRVDTRSGEYVERSK